MKLLREYINLLLIESRISDAQAKYPDVDVEELVTLDPTNNNKYLTWMAKQAGSGIEIVQIGNAISKFHANQQRLKKKDINAYKDLAELEAALQIVSKSSQTKKKKIMKSGAETIYSDKDVIVKYVATKDAVRQYGFGTRWCITMKDGKRFKANNIVLNAVFYYVITKEPKDDNNDKIVMAVYRNVDNAVNRIEYYNAVNHRIEGLPTNLNTEIDKAVISHASSLPINERSHYLKGDYDNDLKKKTKVADELLNLSLVIDNIDEDFIFTVVSKIDDIDHLNRLVKHKNMTVRLALLKNKNATTEIFEKLLDDDVIWVQANAIKFGVDLSWDVLKRFANNESYDIKAALITHKNTPKSVLKTYANDKNAAIRKKALARLESN